VDENAGRISGGGVAAHRDTGMAVLLEVGIENRAADRAGSCSLRHLGESTVIHVFIRKCVILSL
jgi:hypothetical protein